MTGPEGVTKQATSFSRRDAVIDLAGRAAIHGASADNAAGRVEILVNRLLRDDRVVPVLAPAARTSGELLRIRDATGRIVRTVDQSERRYTTVDLLAAETELLGRATGRQNAGVARIPQGTVDQVLAAQPGLDPDQQTMVRTLATSGAGVDVVVGKAGTGKSTALGAYRAALDAAAVPIVGVAPSATAAHQLEVSAGITDTATVDRLLAELRHARRTLPHGVVVVLDEAAMCPTRTRLALQRAVDAVNGKIVDVGDHRQIPSVDVGGGHYALAQRLGATVLGHNHRFRDPVYRDAAELFRNRQPAAAVEVLRTQGAVSDHHAKPVDAWGAMVDDWLTQRANGHDVLMLASERATVAELNRLSRAHLVARGDITRRSRTYKPPDDRRTITLAAGDEVILRRNHRLAQPGGITTQLRNGMTGRVTATHRRGITVELDAAHRTPGSLPSVTLPADYVGQHVDYGYARTVDTAQGATVDQVCSRPPHRQPPNAHTSRCPAGGCPIASTPPVTAPGSTPSADPAARRSPLTKRPLSVTDGSGSYDSSAHLSTTDNRRIQALASSRSDERWHRLMSTVSRNVIKSSGTGEAHELRVVQRTATRCRYPEAASANS